MTRTPARRGLRRTVLEAAVAALLVTTFLVSGVAISGDSMEPTLFHGERVLVPRLETWLRRLGVGEFQRGEVVYFPAPDQPSRLLCPWLCSHLIKRIVAVEGDRVELSAGTLLVNGVELDERHLGRAWRGSFTMPETVVPEGHVFVLGDNRSPFGSFDSRAFGPVPERDLEGRAALVVWPPLRRDEAGRWRWNLRRLPVPEAFRELQAPPGAEPKEL